MTRLTFLGTGDYLTAERYWNGFVINERTLVEPCPGVVPHLRRCGLDAGHLGVILVSHFHADHTFGWPFLLLELLRRSRRAPVYVVGPPGAEERFAAMMDVGGVANIREAVAGQLELRYIEVDGGWQAAGELRFRAVEVDHVPHLRCFGFVLDIDGRTLGYSGDTRPCSGLDELASVSETLVLECNGPHPPPPVHMDVPDVANLRRRFPNVRLVLTHLGAGINARDIENCIVPDDFATIEL